jgi:iron complex outermembrane receptor protein
MTAFAIDLYANPLRIIDRALVRFGFSAFLALPAVCAQAQTAQEARDAPGVELPAVDVEGARADVPALVGAVARTPATSYVVTPEGLQFLSGGGGTNPLRAIATLPSVDAPAIDAYGLANIPGGNKGVRIRGELGQHGFSNGTLEGLPVTGVNPGPGYEWLIDNENLRGVELSQGPIAPDKAAFFTNAGVINSLLRWPEPKGGAEFSQSFGASGFLRSFARLDSGLLLDATTSMFVSGSWTEADKWRGFGQAPAGKTDVSFGVETHPIDSFEAKLFFSYSDMSGSTYRALTYPQAVNLGQYRYFDFLPNSNPPPANAVNYYGYNRQSFTDWMLLSELTYRVNETNRVVVKPYYFNEKGAYFDGMANGKVRNWIIDHDWYGLTAEWQSRIAATDLKLGYWWTSLQLPGPPTAWKLYNPNSAGGLSGASWAILAEETNRHQFNSVYAMLDKSIDALRLQFGARYLRETLPGINEYNTAGIGDVSYAAALAASSGVIANRSATSWSTGAFLPYMAASYDVNAKLQLKASIGANYGAPAFDVWPVFQQNAAAFLAKGITANQLWHDIKPETSAAADVGFRLSFGGPSGLGHGYIEPILYYAKNANKAVSYDPGIGVAYSQNVAESHSYGAQAIAHWLPTETLDLFATGSFNRNIFDVNLPTLPGASNAVVAAAAVAGGQLPDVPLWLSSVGANWRLGDFSIAPVLHYVSLRFGDAARTQPIPGYAVADLNLAFERKLSWGALQASLSVTNIFDKGYIGFINNGYYQQSSATGAIYYPGAPRTIWAKLSFKM